MSSPPSFIVLGSYILHNVHLLLTSGIGTPYDPSTGQGTLGKNYAYQITPSVDVFLDDKILNPFVGAGSLGMVVDDFNGNSFDHTGLGFLHGGYIGGYVTTGRPIETELLPEGTPKWGKKWKQAFVKNYLTSISLSLMGSVMPHRENYLDLDPTYRDVYGKPLMRMTFDFKQNEWKMQDFEMQKMVQIANAMNRARWYRKNAGRTTTSRLISAPIIPAAPSWGLPRMTAWSIATCSIGRCRTFSSSAPARSAQQRI